MRYQLTVESGDQRATCSLRQPHRERAARRQSHFGNDDFAQFAPGMKTLDDALELRSRIFGAFGNGRGLEDDPARRRAWLTFVVVGMGPTGVEMAGQIAEDCPVYARFTGNFRAIDPADARVVLLDGGPEIL